MRVYSQTDAAFRSLLLYLGSKGYCWKTGQLANETSFGLDAPIAINVYENKTISWSLFSVYDTAEQKEQFIAECEDSRDYLLEKLKNISVDSEGNLNEAFLSFLSGLSTYAEVQEYVSNINNEEMEEENN